MALRRLLALEVAAFLVWNSTPAPPIVLGVVVGANRRHLNAGAVSAGATVYDGDHFSTETGGMLLLRGNALMLQLAEESAVILRSGANGAPAPEATLSNGTLVFSTTRAAVLGIAAREARIRPIADARTIAQVSLTGRKELCIYARRGSLQFWYRGETEAIAEGTAYRVILDPSEGDAGKKQTVKDGRRRKAFLLISIGMGAAGAAVSIHGMHHTEGFESPDRP